ncbi:hypothetical protein H7992_14175 [Sporosarcina sp. resist]|uniref:hypothetical protein n=1 Tax=Sporosarcina sp. resist TaxID=2762563 RepID=UPI00164DDE3D|nr:hypothetical protein [Sporosarcina sp. resist]QNK86406.1 hypothetical protein H7992_14175 [Sporosarcina sp. resist]
MGKYSGQLEQHRKSVERVTGASSGVLGQLEQHRKSMERVTGASSGVLGQLEQHRKSMERVTGASSGVLGQLEQHRKSMERVTGASSGVLGQLEQHRKSMERVTGASSGVLGQLEQHRKSVERVTGASSGVLGQLEQHRKSVERVTGASSGVLGQLEQHRKSVERVTGASSGVLGQLEQHRKSVERVTGASSGVLRQWEQHRKSMEEFIITPILKSFNAGTDSFQMSDGVAIVDNYLGHAQSDLESEKLCDSNLNNQDLIEWLSAFLENCINQTSRLQKVFNTIDTEKARVYFFGMLTIVSSVLTIISFLQGDTSEVHIHNYDEDVKIETESNGNRTDIYIEKNDSFIEEEQIKEEQWISGGDRT